MAVAVLEEAARTPGKEAVAMEAYARALLQLPTIIADNGGYDSALLVSQLRAGHTQGQHRLGISEWSSPPPSPGWLREGTAASGAVVRGVVIDWSVR